MVYIELAPFQAHEGYCKQEKDLMQSLVLQDYQKA